jgi:hypothetical protein
VFQRLQLRELTLHRLAEIVQPDSVGEGVPDKGSELVPINIARDTPRFELHGGQPGLCNFRALVIVNAMRDGYFNNEVAPRN